MRTFIIPLLLLLISCTGTTQSSKKIISGYYPSWRWYDRDKLVTPQSLDYSKYDVLNYAFINVEPDGSLSLNDPFADKTLMKNAFVYDLGSELGRYTPRTQFCELVLNGEYRGVYLMVEKIKRDNNRVDIARLEPQEISGDDLTGGYIIRIDRQQDEFWQPLVDFGFGLSFYNYFSPDPELMPQVQKDYIRNYITDFERALQRQDFSTTTGYRFYADVSSFVDYFIINELTKNLDAYRLSAYLYKDKDSKGGKLTMGPLWDYNLSCGGVNIGFGDWPSTPDNWVYQELPDGVPFWWETFLNDNYYTSCLKERWVELREVLINEDRFNEIIDGYATYLDEAKDRNFEIFPLEDSVWSNNHSGFTYQQEIDTLKGFLRERLKWMDTEIASLPGSEDCMEWDPEIITGLEPEKEGFEVFPNPVSGTLTTRFILQSASEVTFELYDPAGRRIKSQSYEFLSGSHELKIDLSEPDLRGTYIYFLRTPSKTISVGKLIKK